MIKAWLDATAGSLVKLAARAALIAASALQIMPASAVAQTGGDAAVLAQEGIRQGPQGREFYFTIPNTVPAGAKRGDILWMRRREDAPAGIDAWRMIYVTEGVGTKLTYVGVRFMCPPIQRRVNGGSPFGIIRRPAMRTPARHHGGAQRPFRIRRD